MTPLTLRADRAGERVDQFLSRQLPQLSRSAAQKLLEEGAVTLKGLPVKKNYKTAEGDELVLSLPDPVEVDVVPHLGFNLILFFPTICNKSFGYIEKIKFSSFISVHCARCV